MQSRQVFSDIPYSKLRPASHYGGRAADTFGVSIAIVLFGHLFFSAWTPLQQAIAAILGASLFFLLFGRLSRIKSRLETFVGHPQLKSTSAFEVIRPNEQSKLRAWTRSGDVIELVFDSGSWMLVRGDVNDRQWRDVQRLLVWCKRVPSRAVL
jgi:hypothetical protein